MGTEFHLCKMRDLLHNIVIIVINMYFTFHSLENKSHAMYFFNHKNQTEKPTTMFMTYLLEYLQTISGKSKEPALGQLLTGGSRLLELKCIISPEEKL